MYGQESNSDRHECTYFPYLWAIDPIIPYKIRSRLQSVCYNRNTMPARDTYHQTVKNALVKDGWTITHDPLRIRLARRKNLFVDLGAERMLAADRGTEKIAVEVKSFISPSDMKDLEEATGQFVLYERLLKRYYPDRILFLAVSEDTKKRVFEEEAGQTLIEDGIIRLVTFEPVKEAIVQWIQ
jgi:hypothetical protein